MKSPRNKMKRKWIRWFLETMLESDDIGAIVLNKRHEQKTIDNFSNSGQNDLIFCPWSLNCGCCLNATKQSIRHGHVSQNEFEPNRSELNLEIEWTRTDTSIQLSFFAEKKNSLKFDIDLKLWLVKLCTIMFVAIFECFASAELFNPYFSEFSESKTSLQLILVLMKFMKTHNPCGMQNKLPSKWKTTLKIATRALNGNKAVRCSIKAY